MPGKKYQEAVKLIDKETLYDPEQAIELVKQTAKAKFDETVEVAVRLGVDPKKQARPRIRQRRQGARSRSGRRRFRRRPRHDQPHPARLVRL